jgi:hypothetical protein
MSYGVMRRVMQHDCWHFWFDPDIKPSGYVVFKMLDYLLAHYQKVRLSV